MLKGLVESKSEALSSNPSTPKKHQKHALKMSFYNNYLIRGIHTGPVKARDSE
jgi:hypothetical protein